MATTAPSEAGFAANRPNDEELPDTRLFWLWVGRALRPYAGWVIAAFGFLFIIVGYLGVSREALVAKQLPYLISGGVGGIALVGAGAAFVAVEQIRRDSRRIDRVERMVLELHDILLAGAESLESLESLDLEESALSERSERSRRRASSNGLEPGRVSANGVGDLVALPVGQSFHRPDCSMVQGKDNVQRVTAGTARSRGLKACRLCEPDLADTNF